VLCWAGRCGSGAGPIPHLFISLHIPPPLVYPPSHLHTRMPHPRCRIAHDHAAIRAAIARQAEAVRDNVVAAQTTLVQLTIGSATIGTENARLVQVRRPSPPRRVDCLLALTRSRGHLGCRHQPNPPPPILGSTRSLQHALPHTPPPPPRSPPPLPRPHKRMPPSPSSSLSSGKQRPWQMHSWYPPPPSPYFHGKALTAGTHLEGSTTQLQHTPLGRAHPPPPFHTHTGATCSSSRKQPGRSNISS
jgi:hypothetical protein